MTVVYEVQHIDGFYYVATKDTAVRDVLQLRRDGDPNAAARKIFVTDKLGKRELFWDLLNNEGFAVRQEDVEL